MPILSNLEDVAVRFNAFAAAINARSKQVKVNSTTTKTSTSGVVDLTGVVVTGINASDGTPLTISDGRVTLPASGGGGTLTPSTTSVTDPTA